MSTATLPLRLYEYVDEYQTVLDWIEEHEEQIVAAGGVLPPELESLLDDITGAVTEKVKRIALLIQNLTASQKAAAAEAQRLTALAKGYERKADSLKAYLKLQLQRLGLPRLETDVVKVRIQQNGRPSIRPVDPAKIPEAYQRVVIELDGDKAYQALKLANCLPDKPGRVEIEGLVVELGDHVRIW